MSNSQQPAQLKGVFVMKHTEIGDKYIKLNKDKRMFSRGMIWGYADGVWSSLPNVRHELWMLCKNNKTVNPNTGLVSSVMEYVSGALYKNETEIDCQTSLLNLKNGVLNIRTLKLLQHHHSHYFTAQLGFEYDPKATCPTWDKFVDEVLVNDKHKPDDKLIDFIQEAFGYSLTASVEHEISFWLIGEGANGKSTMLKVLEQLAGSAALQLNLGLLNRDKYQLADLAAKRVVVCSESPDTTVADSILKAIISGDTMSVRGIYGKPFSLTPIAKVWWAMNNPPRVNDTSEGFWRKMKVIPFNRTFEYEERNKKLFTILKGEMSGIFNWALEGYKRLEQRGYFTECEQIEDATNRYRDESDAPKQFISECCKRGPDATVTSKELYRAYHAWCKESGHRSTSSNRMGREWRRLGLVAVRDVDGNRAWAGIDMIDAMPR